MRYKTSHLLWVLLTLASIAGLMNLRLDMNVLNLLPQEIPAVRGLKLYQQNFSNARELFITLKSPAAETSESAAHQLAVSLSSKTSEVSQVTWQPPWREHPGQLAELLAYLWYNQAPKVFRQLATRLDNEHLQQTLAAAKETLSTSLSPEDVGRLSYDPLGFTQLPESGSGLTSSFGSGEAVFASADGTFRILFVRAKRELEDYRKCREWLASVEQTVDRTLPAEWRRSNKLKVGYTGGPVFVAETAEGMQHDVNYSLAGTSVLIAMLFWLAHRRVKPMLWLLALLALVLMGTLGIGSLVFGSVNVVSMGFAAILLGLAVDYAVIHYQEALAHPDLSIPDIRKAIAPSIAYAAVTTTSAFLTLNFGGLPGLGQLGTLVAIGVSLSACVMILAFLPPLFPERMSSRNGASSPAYVPSDPPARARTMLAVVATLIILACSIYELRRGLPRIDPTAGPLRPRQSTAYETMEEMRNNIEGPQEPLWLLVGGTDENEVSRRLELVRPVLDQEIDSKLIRSYSLPAFLWCSPERQADNRPTALRLSGQLQYLNETAGSSGFTESAMALDNQILKCWSIASASIHPYWPTNEVSSWILEKVTARSPSNYFALGLVYPRSTNLVMVEADTAQLQRDLPAKGVWVSGWQLLGTVIFQVVQGRLWQLLLPMSCLVLFCLCLAFRRPMEVLLSLGSLALSGLCLLAVMRWLNWKWNLVNLLGIPLVLGTGVDYSIFMQLALRRYQGNLAMTSRSVGRALLLCGGTATLGFGSLAWSSNAGMASLGRICAVGIALNVLLAIFLLPWWWRKLGRLKG